MTHPKPLPAIPEVIKYLLQRLRHTQEPQQEVLECGLALAAYSKDGQQYLALGRTDGYPNQTTVTIVLQRMRWGTVPRSRSKEQHKNRYWIILEVPRT